LVEAGEHDLGDLVVAAEQREGGVDAVEAEVPAALARLAPAVADRALRRAGLAGGGVEDERLPLGVLLLRAEVGGAQEAARHEALRGLLEADEERQVRVAADVVLEVGRLALDVELAQD